MIASLRRKCTSQSQMGFLPCSRLPILAALLCLFALGACDIDHPPSWLTGDADLPPMRPEVGSYRDLSTPPVNGVPDRPIPPVTVQERQDIRSELEQENKAATIKVAPLRAQMDSEAAAMAPPAAAATDASAAAPAQTASSAAPAGSGSASPAPAAPPVAP